MIKKNKLASNITALSILQIFNYLLPLLLIPYLIKVLGSDLYGIIIFAQTVVIYFTTLVDYGFSLSATRDIARYRSDKVKVSEIFSSVTIIRLLLFLVSLILFVIIIFSFERFAQYEEVYLLTFIAVLGQALFPLWFFQGIEEMKYITIINITTKTFFTILTFIFVQSEADYLYVPLFYALGFLVSGVWSLYIVKIKYNETINMQPFTIIKKYFIQSTQYFWSRLSSMGYSNTNTFIVGLIFPPQYVTFYFIADKIVNVVLSIFFPIQQAIYPYLSNQFNNKLFLRFLVSLLAISIMMSILIVYLDEFVSLLLFQRTVEVFLETIEILVYLIPISTIYVMLGAPLLLAKGYVKEFNYSIIYGFIVHLILLLSIYILSINFDIKDNIIALFAYALILSKTIVLFLRIYYVYINKLHKEVLL